MATIKLKFRPSTTLEKDGRLYYQIIHKRVVRQVATDCYISPSEWNESKEQLILPSTTSTPRLRVLRNIAAELEWQQEQLTHIIKALEASGKEYTADEIALEYEKRFGDKETVFTFFRRHITMLHEAGRHSTAEHYDQTLRSFKNYREGCDLHFDMLTPQLTLSYETWLKNNHLCRNTTSFYMRIMRTLYNKAVEAGMTTDCQPFRPVYTGIDKTAKRAITIKDIKRIKSAELSHCPSLDFARDMFLLSFYLRGISPIDLAYLRKSDIRQGDIVYSRSKTGQQMRIHIEPDIQRLLDKYKETRTQYLLPIIKRKDGTEHTQYRNNTQLINRHLKKLTEKLGLSSPLTLYVARHSWASIAQSNHIPTSVISGAMGHDSELTTQIYLASIQTAQIDEANSMIINSLMK
ncbi:MAG: phage integrase SAM-like domain-containing protein [Bacteroides sp.]